MVLQRCRNAAAAPSNCGLFFVTATPSGQVHRPWSSALCVASPGDRLFPAHAKQTSGTVIGGLGRYITMRRAHIAPLPTPEERTVAVDAHHLTHTLPSPATATARGGTRRDLYRFSPCRLPRRPSHPVWGSSAFPPVTRTELIKRARASEAPFGNTRALLFFIPSSASWCTMFCSALPYLPPLVLPRSYRASCHRLMFSPLAS